MIMQPKPTITEDTIFFYIEPGGEQRGPVTLRKLRMFARSGHVTRAARVWCEAMPDWKPLSAVAQTFAIPFPTSLTAAANQPHISQPDFSIPKKRTSLAAKISIALAVLAFGFVALIWIGLANGGREFTAASEAIRAVAEKEIPSSPAVITFSGPMDSTLVKHSDGKVTVTGWVDAPNAFGVMLRKRWIVTLENGVVKGAFIVH